MAVDYDRVYNTAREALEDEDVQAAIELLMVDKGMSPEEISAAVELFDLLMSGAADDE